MKRVLIGLMAAAVAVIGFGASASAAPANTLQGFGTGTVTIRADGTATIVNASGQFGGVYTKSKSQSGMLLNAVSFSFTSTGDVAGGAPRFSIPINTDGTGGSVAGYAFLDALNCDPTAVNGSTVFVSTTNTNCRVFFGSNISGYDNWNAFAVANPTYRISQGHFPFIIADEAGNYALSGIDLG